MGQNVLILLLPFFFQIVFKYFHCSIHILVKIHLNCYHKICTRLTFFLSTEET